MSGPGRRRRRRRRRTPIPEVAESGRIVESAEEIGQRHDTGPRLSGGDVDADWRNAAAGGDEAVGGSTATPDQDIVDELGEALGVPRAADAEVRTSAEILAERDRHRWRLEREAEGEEGEAGR